MPEYAGLILLGLLFQTHCFMTVAGSEYREIKYVLEEHNVLANNPTNTTSVKSRLLCAFECEIEKFCVAFAFNKVGGECYLYDRDINGEVYDTRLNTNIYINNKRCGSIPTTPYGTPESVQATYPAGTRVNYTCMAGAFSDASSQAHCLPSGEWQLPCKPVKSCQEAYNLGVTVTPSVIIRPDLNQSAVTMSCEITTSGVYTIIGHDVANRAYVKGYDAERSYFGNINYHIDLQKVINIVDASVECEQYIKFECHHVHTSHLGLNTRNGSLATYLIGGVKGQMDCACHRNNTCVGGLLCNCAVNDYVLRFDEGYIRYKEDLPITAILIGDTGESGEYAYYTVGSVVLIVVVCLGVSLFKTRSTSDVKLFMVIPWTIAHRLQTPSVDMTSQFQMDAMALAVDSAV